jgi:hypothetical protein
MNKVDLSDMNLLQYKWCDKLADNSRQSVLPEYLSTQGWASLHSQTRALAPAPRFHTQLASKSDDHDLDDDLDLITDSENGNGSLWAVIMTVGS